MSIYDTLTDKELMKAFYEAQEEQNGIKIRNIKKEINKRWRFE